MTQFLCLELVARNCFHPGLFPNTKSNQYLRAYGRQRLDLFIDESESSPKPQVLERSEPCPLSFRKMKQVQLGWSWCDMDVAHQTPSESRAALQVTGGIT